MALYLQLNVRKHKALVSMILFLEVRGRGRVRVATVRLVYILML